MKNLKSSFIVLNKYPYQESSLIIAALSLEYGKLNFIMRGARRVSKTKFPMIDILRELSIEFKESKTDLFTPVTVDLISSFDNIALRPRVLFDIINTAKFIKKNTFPHIQYPKVYPAFKILLQKATRSNFNFFDITLFKLVFLYENGFLPDFFEDDLENRQKIFIQKMISNATESTKNLPNLTEEYQRKFSDWISILCKRNGLE